MKKVNPNKKMLKINAQFIKLVITVIVIFSINVFGQSDQLHNDLNKSFKKFDLVRINTQQALADYKSNKTLKLQMSQKNIELTLQPNDLRPRRYRTESTGINGKKQLERSVVSTFKGYLKGESNSYLRINLNKDNIEGYFVSEGERYYIEAAKSYSSSAKSEDFIIYSSDDYLGETGFDCHTEIVKRIKGGKDFVELQKIGDLEGASVLELATEADFEFVTELGGTAQANDEILGTLNMIDGVYEQQLDMTIQVVYQHTWEVADPFVGTNPQAANESFKNYWNANFPQVEYPRDTAHLFSAKSNVVSRGYAYIGSVCRNPTFAYGTSGKVSFQHGQNLVTAHELAHNVGGNHNDTSACGTAIMKSALNGSETLNFCQASINEIGNYVANDTTGSCLAPPVNSAARFDFDGDNRTDTAIYRPTLGQWWYLRSSDGGNKAFQFGAESDKMAPADYTGDGLIDIAFWRESTGEWFILRSEDSSFYGFPFGTSGDIPTPGDFDGDGIADIAVFRPSNVTWYILNSSGDTRIQSFGATGDIPMVNDYDGDGSDDLAIYRPDVQQWWINKSSEGVSAIQFGSPEDIPAPADYTGDGKTDVGVFRPSTGEWFISRSEDSSFYSAAFGTTGDIPVAGDYDGDGTDDLAVWRPDSQIWYLLGSQNGFSAVGFGTSGDIPVPASFIP